jgi:hypothetical protein
MRGFSKDIEILKETKQNKQKKPTNDGNERLNNGGRHHLQTRQSRRKNIRI